MAIRIEAKIVDITTLALDAIVNAANAELVGGGGVDGAIRRAAGRGLAAACDAIAPDEKGVRCPVGQARLTQGFLLPCKFVVHTVGPVWDEHEPLAADALLAECYRSCIRLANTRSVRSIAFPCISTGAYGFPGPRAAQIAVNAVRQELRGAPGIEHVVFACFSDADLWAYQLHIRASG